MAAQALMLDSWNGRLSRGCELGSWSGCWTCMLIQDPWLGKLPRFQTWILWLLRLDCLTAHCSFWKALVSLSGSWVFLLYLDIFLMLSKALWTLIYYLLSFSVSLELYNWENTYKLAENAFWCLLPFQRHWGPGSQNIELGPGIFNHSQENSSSLPRIHSSTP